MKEQGRVEEAQEDKEMRGKRGWVAKFMVETLQ